MLTLQLIYVADSDFLNMIPFMIPFMIYCLKLLASNNTCLIFEYWKREQQSKIPLNAWCPEFLILKYTFSKGGFKKIFTFWLLWWSSFHSSL